MVERMSYGVWKWQRRGVAVVVQEQEGGDFLSACMIP